MLPNPAPTSLAVVERFFIGIPVLGKSAASLQIPLPLELPVRRQIFEPIDRQQGRRGAGAGAQEIASEALPLSGGPAARSLRYAIKPLCCPISDVVQRLL